MLWLSSDHHFGHKNIINLCNRPFDNVDQMNQALIDNHNDRVQHDDVVLLLGDVVMSGGARYVRQMNGIKILVVGNHDKNFRRPGRDANLMEQAGLQNVVHGSLSIYGITVSHFPAAIAAGFDSRYLEHYPNIQSGFLAHGHVHNLWHTRKIGKLRMFNVGVDVNDFAPVELGDIQYAKYSTSNH